ncbi:MAG: insulinase family protein [Treponema sp.]|nr:insulinase family protein [Treponema sp.]
MKKGDLYKGFRVLETIKIQDFEATGIFLKNEKSGLEVFHVNNSDEENLFAFAFRTPPQDSTGVAHVLEHSVLCGSKKYPAKDPFLQLTNQSVNTYLNAFTSSDRTVFPASSLIKKDYFNLMSVYADAVFFPLLKKEIFLQECWRIEDKKIQGVVFNEMKGNYASFTSVAGDAILDSVSGGTCYAFDSGGDPLVIPELTHEKLKAFHKKHYCTNNCLVFLYGNIPTEEQLDFLDENVISKVSSFGKRVSVAALPSPAKPKKNIHSFGPEESDDSEDSKPSIALTWQILDAVKSDNIALESIELMFICELLFGHDCAPVSKVLLKKFPGASLFPGSGANVYARFYSVTLGLRNIDESKKNEFIDIVSQTLKSLCKNGIDQDDIERTFMSFDFANREIKRSPDHGPYAIVLLKRVLRAWTYEKSPWECIFFKKYSDKIKENIKNIPGYLESLIKKYFVENDNYSVVSVVQSKEWSRKRDAQERKLIRKILQSENKNVFDADLKRMIDFQNNADSKKVIDLIPHLEFKDLKERYEKIKTDYAEINGLPFYINKEPTNGIVYANISFPADILKAEDYKYLPLLESTVCDMSWGSLSWDKAAAIAEKLTGGFGAFTRTAKVPSVLNKEIKKNPAVVGRDWFVIYFKFLAENSEKVFDFIGDWLSSVDFNDKKRLRTIINDVCKNAATSVVHSAASYARIRSQSTLNRENAVLEIVTGLKSVFNLNEIKKANVNDLIKNLERIFNSLKKGGAVLHVTSDADGIEESKKYFERLVKKLKLSAPKKKLSQKDSDFYLQTEINSGRKKVSRKDCFVDEVFTIPGSVGFSSCTVSSAGYNTKESMADNVLAHFLRTSDLWKQIRTLGGAYGVYLSTYSDVEATSFLTYRDPKPMESLEFFERFRKELANRKFTLEEVQKAIAGVYSDEIEPFTPVMRGATGYLRELYAHVKDQDKRRMKFLLSLTTDDIEKSAQRYSKACELGKKVLICGKSIVDDKIIQNSRIIIEIPL